MYDLVYSELYQHTTIIQMKNHLLKHLCYAMLLGIIVWPEAFAQKKKNKSSAPEAAVTYDESLYDKKKIPIISPF